MAWRNEWNREAGYCGLKRRSFIYMERQKPFITSTLPIISNRPPSLLLPFQGWPDPRSVLTSSHPVGQARLSGCTLEVLHFSVFLNDGYLSCNVWSAESGAGGCQKPKGGPGFGSCVSLLPGLISKSSVLALRGVAILWL